MIVAKKQWMKAWTNCSKVFFSQERKYETPHNEYNDGIGSHLSITRIPLYNQICVDINIDDFCKQCHSCIEDDENE